MATGPFSPQQPLPAVITPTGVATGDFNNDGRPDLAVSPELHKKSLEGNWNGMARLITDEMLETFAVSGTYEDIGKKLHERYAGLLDRISPPRALSYEHHLLGTWASNPPCGLRAPGGRDSQLTM